MGIAPNTQAVYIAGLAGFYDELVHTGFPLPNGNPFKNPLVKLPRGARDPKNPSRSFTETQVAQILDAAETDRDRAILALLFGAGLRKSELLNLVTEDVSKKGDVTILTLRNTKSQVRAEHPIADWVTNLLQAHIKKRKGKIFDLSPAGLDKIFSRLVAKAGIEGKWSPHDARCTAINILVAKGAPMQHIQNFSRHSSLKMVEEYVRRHNVLDNNPGLEISYGKYGNSNKPRRSK